MLRQLLGLRPGEGLPVAWLAVMGALYAAATSLGDDIAQAVFVARAGAAALPRMILLKGLLDVAAAAVYTPLARGRNAGRVWRVALAIYIGCVLGGRALAADGGTAGAYALYVAHECAWTILTIHWGVFLLETFDASQARRLFPLLFTAARLGGMAAGALLQGLAEVVGAVDMLLVGAALAGATALLSLMHGRIHGSACTAPPAIAPATQDGAPGAEAEPDTESELGARNSESELGLGIRSSDSDSDSGSDSDSDSGSDSDSDSDSDSGSGSGSGSKADSAPPDRASPRWAGWRHAAGSPLVRAIALSTAAMVLVRYGLHLVSLDTIDSALGGDENRVAAFLGRFGAWANAAGALLGVVVVPRILARLGVGAANLAYAVATVVAWGLLVAAPALWSAALARFAGTQLKDALKTPLSTLFYGAEPPPRRAPARAFVFGAVIPVATVSTALAFEVAGQLGTASALVAWLGLVMACAFVALCTMQNRRWRLRLADLLHWKLARTPAPDAARLAATRDALAALRPGTLGAARLELLARGLASPDARTRALAGELLAELAPRRRARAVARRLAG